MKKAVIILVILGTLASLGLGIKWLSDYNDYKSELATATSIAQGAGQSQELTDALKEVEQTKNCAYALIACGIIALVTVFLLGKLKKIGAGIILVTGIVPAIFSPMSLVFTFLLVLAGILAFFIKPKTIVA